MKENIPVTIRVDNQADMPIHWRDRLQIFLILSGEMVFSLENDTVSCREGQILLINRRCLHAYYASACVHVLVEMDLNSLPFVDSDVPERFLLDSVSFPHPTRYDYVRYLLARLVEVQSMENAAYRTLALAYELLSELMQSFREDPSPDAVQAGAEREHRIDERMRGILSYMQEHYRDNLTLQSVAEAHYLSVPYLSSIFRKTVGINFSDYYNRIRMQNAVNDLMMTDASIEEVARANGFSDSRTFLRLFKEQYQMLPSAYRRQLREAGGIYVTNAQSGMFYPAVSESHYLPLIHSILASAPVLSNAPAPPAQIVCPAIDYTENGTALTHNFHRICSISSARSILHSETQQALTMIQKEIHYEYIMFYGLLNIDPYLYSEAPDGTPSFTFVLVDKVLDFLLSIDLKPIINFSYMPVLLRRQRKDESINYLFSPDVPKDFSLWQLLISRLTGHLTERYGEEVVSTWLFNVWKKPDVGSFFIGEETFHTLYRITHDAVKSISRSYRFGAPLLAYNSDFSRAWDARFFRFCRANRCEPDFVCFGYYADEFQENRGKPAYLDKTGPLMKDPDGLRHYLDEVKTFCSSMGLADVPQFLMEWNLTVSQRNRINDSCFPACYITKNLMDNYDRMDAFCHWMVSDFAEENELPQDLFFGGNGLLTHNGVKKAVFYAYQFASLLGDECIGKGPGYFVSRHGSKRRITAIFYNYIHYSDTFAEGKLRASHGGDCYQAFSNLEPVLLSLQITGLQADYCNIREFFVNREDGSSYDRWIRMGAVQLQDADLNILKTTQPGLHIRTQKIHSGVLQLEAELAPLEIRVVEIDLQRRYI